MTYHLLTSHSLRDPPSLSKNSMNSLGEGMPRARGPWVGRARGRGRRISLEAAGPAPPGEGLPVRQGTQIQLVVSADTWPVCAGIFAQTTAPKVVRPSTHACPRGEGREGQRVHLEWKHLSSCPSSGPKGTV